MTPGSLGWCERLEALCRGYEQLLGRQPYAVLSDAKEQVRAANLGPASESDALLRVALAVARAGGYQGAA